MLVSVAECKGFRDVAGSEHDAELSRLIPSVQALVEELCGRSFEQAATQTDYLNGGKAWGRRPQRLLLTRPPVRSIVSIHDDPLRAYGASTLVDPTYYVLTDPEAGIVEFDGYTPQAGLHNLKIVYDGGFLPSEAKLGPIKQVIIEQVWMLREKGASNLIGVRSRSVADGNIQYVNLDLTPEQERTLNLYKLDVVV